MENITLEELINATNEESLGRAYLYLMEGREPGAAIRDANLAKDGQGSRRVLSQFKQFTIDNAKKVRFNRGGEFIPTKDEIELLENNLPEQMVYWLRSLMAGEKLGLKDTHIRRRRKLVEACRKILQESKENE
jgi:hypothetical protein